MDGFAGAIGVSESDGKASPVVHCYRPSASVDVRYYAYLLRDLAICGFVTSLAKGIRERSTAFDVETFRSLVLPVPPLATQRAIADYLDTETARIDALITKKQRMIEVLEERTNSAFLEGVLGERLQGRNSLSGYYALVPDGWSETSLRHLGCEVQTGPFGSQLHAGDYIQDGWPVVNPMNIIKGSIEPVATMTVSNETRDELSRHILRPGDIVFGRRGEMGRAGLVEERHAGWLCGTGSLRLRLTGGYLLPEYLKLLLGTAPARAYFGLASVGSTMDNLNSEIVLAFPCLVPPLETQRKVIREAAMIEVRSQRLRDRVEQQVSLLLERRQALITAVVTGEFEVPGVAA